MGVVTAWRKIRWSLAHRGVGGTLRVLGSAVGRRSSREPERVHPFDQQFGTDTGGLIGGGALAVGSVNDAHITAYVGIAPSRLRAGLDQWESLLLPGEKVTDFCFVDLGCGKGRAVLLASERPFRDVTGVELNPGLAATAERNVQVWKELGRGVVCPVVQQGDVTEFAYPQGALLVFIYNAFGAPVLRRVLDALERQVLRSGCRVDLLYQNEGPTLPLRSDPRLTLLWTGSLPVEEQEAGAELVGSPEDVTSLYRWKG